jgi:hypothetical protein
MNIDSQEAAEIIRNGGSPGPMRVNGKLELTGFRGETLPDGLHCYELDASDSELTALPEDLRIDGRLTLNNCPKLRKLPDRFTAGSISLRNCTCLETLPEGLNVWFLDLTGCTAFNHWPKTATIDRGALILRNCASIQSLPSWLGRLAQLDLSGCVQIKEIPDGISVTGWVDVGGAQISSIPPSLAGAPLRWRGVRVSERVAFHPEALTAEEVLAETNAEVRRVMIERMGYMRFAAEAKAAIIDEDRDRGGRRQLLKIDLREDEPLVGLFCKCPSTAREYFLRVPPSVSTCHQAAAWIAGFDDASLYQPVFET